MTRRRSGRLAVAALFAAAAEVGAAAPAPVDVSCVRAGGAVRFEVTSDAGEIAFRVTYPRSVGSYLGGFVGGTKQKSADVKFFLDLDGNPNTGMTGDPVWAPGAAGSEFSIETQEVETSVARDAAGEWVRKPVLMVIVQKQDEFFDLPGGIPANWEMETDGRWQPVDWMHVPDSRTARLRLPWSAIGGKAGARVRVTAVVPVCHDAPPFAGIGETTIVLR